MSSKILNSKQNGQNNNDCVVELKNKNIYYQDFHVLENIDLKIDKGEKVAFIGPSGSGKTTLLNHIYSTLDCNASMVHQHYALVSNLSTYNNIYMGLLDQHSTIKNIINLIKPNKIELEKIKIIADQLGIKDKLFKKCGQLSGGQQQRTAVARALYKNGDIIMADEPISSLDIFYSEVVMDIIIKASDTVILTLHAVEYAKKYANRLIGIKDKSIFFDLPTTEVDNLLIQQLYADEEN